MVASKLVEGQRPGHGFLFCNFAGRWAEIEQVTEENVIAELAGISGAIELEVIVNEEIRAARPIKLEDRVKHMTEKNPLIAELRKALDLEVE